MQDKKELFDQQQNKHPNYPIEDSNQEQHCNEDMDKQELLLRAIASNNRKQITHILNTLDDIKIASLSLAAILFLSFEKKLDDESVQWMVVQLLNHNKDIASYPLRFMNGFMDGIAAFHFLAFIKNDKLVLALANLFLDFDVNPNLTCDNGRNILHYACKRGGASELIAFILEKKIDPNVQDHASLTCLHYALTKKNPNFKV
ncbi:MAG: ankyrin repeat domain-containing protein, partial [Legionella longbeachae]|nr:ankyrin repeat domain-containing protein [Legionella longbeachae]